MALQLVINEIALGSVSLSTQLFRLRDPLAVVQVGVPPLIRLKEAQHRLPTTPEAYEALEDVTSNALGNGAADGGG